MQNNTLWATLLTTALLMGLCGGCSVMKPVLSQQSTPTDLPALDYLIWAQDATMESLSQEIRRLDQKGKQTSVIDQTRLAIVLSAPSASTAESEKRALALLSKQTLPEKMSVKERDYVSLARVWTAALEQRMKWRTEKQQNISLQQQLSELQQQNGRLQEKLNTLSTIEQQLMEREKSTNDE